MSRRSPRRLGAKFSPSWRRLCRTDPLFATCDFACARHCWKTVGPAYSNPRFEWTS